MFDRRFQQNTYINNDILDKNESGIFSEFKSKVITNAKGYLIKALSKHKHKANLGAEGAPLVGGFVRGYNLVRGKDLTGRKFHIGEIITRSISTVTLVISLYYGLEAVLGDESFRKGVGKATVASIVGRSTWLIETALRKDHLIEELKTNINDLGDIKDQLD